MGVRQQLRFQILLPMLLGFIAAAVCGTLMMVGLVPGWVDIINLIYNREEQEFLLASASYTSALLSAQFQKVMIICFFNKNSLSDDSDHK